MKKTGSISIILVLVFACQVEQNSTGTKIKFNCDQDSLVEYYSGEITGVKGVLLVSKKSFKKQLNTVVKKMNSNFELNDSETIFSIELANTLRVMNEKYLTELFEEFENINTFSNEWDSTYFDYIKCNNKHYEVRSSGIYFPDLLIQYRGFSFSCRFLFIDFHDEFTPCNSTKIKMYCDTLENNPFLYEQKRGDIELN